MVLGVDEPTSRSRVAWHTCIGPSTPPAVSCSTRISVASITSGVFFPPACARRRTVGSGRPRRPAPATGGAAGDGVRIEAQKSGEHAVAAVAEFHGFQSGIQAALLLVQQAVEQNDGSFQLIGRHFQTSGIDDRGNRLVATTCQRLPLADGWIDGGIEEQAGDQLPGDPVLLNEVA